MAKTRFPTFLCNIKLVHPQKYHILHLCSVESPTITYTCECEQRLFKESHLAIMVQFYTFSLFSHFASFPSRVGSKDLIDDLAFSEEYAKNVLVWVSVFFGESELKAGFFFLLNRYLHFPYLGISSLFSLFMFWAFWYFRFLHGFPHKVCSGLCNCWSLH